MAWNWIEVPQAQALCMFSNFFFVAFCSWFWLWFWTGWPSINSRWSGRLICQFIFFIQTSEIYKTNFKFHNEYALCKYTQLVVAALRIGRSFSVFKWFLLVANTSESIDVIWCDWIIGNTNQWYDNGLVIFKHCVLLDYLTVASIIIKRMATFDRLWHDDTELNGAGSINWFICDWIFRLRWLPRWSWPVMLGNWLSRCSVHP